MRTFLLKPLDKMFPKTLSWYERSISHFSLQYQYIVKQTGDENIENHQLGDIILNRHPILSEVVLKNCMVIIGRRINIELVCERVKSNIHNQF